MGDIIFFILLIDKILLNFSQTFVNLTDQKSNVTTKKGGSILAPTKTYGWLGHWFQAVITNGLDFITYVCFISVFEY